VASTSQLGGQFTSSTDVYNTYKQVTTASNPASSGTTYSSVSDSYTVAPDGQLTADKPAGASQINYGYNSKEELTSVSNPNNGSTPDTSLGYTPDGQRCWEVASTSMQSGTCTAPPTGATSLEWNALGQLCASGGTASSGSSCSSPPSGATTYAYNGDGLRMTEVTPTAGTFAFTWDTVDGGTDPLAIDDGQSDFIYGPTLFGGTAPVEQVSATTGTVTYLTTIPSGIQDVLNSGGNVQEESAYTTYGTRAPESTQTPGTAPTAFGFQGSYTDPSGLVYLINRYYDPSTDQFLSVDPKVAATLQPYVFTGSDPLNSTDPLGLYRYKYREYLPRRFGSPKKVMSYFKKNVTKVFPFKVTGGRTIERGESLVLHPEPGLVHGVGTVKVDNVTATSFTFKVTSKGYFDPPGSTITFSTGEHDGQTYLEQTASAPDAGTLSNVMAPPVATQTWTDQASNLESAMAGGSTCNDNAAESVESLVSGVNVC